MYINGCFLQVSKERVRCFMTYFGDRHTNISEPLHLAAGDNGIPAKQNQRQTDRRTHRPRGKLIRCVCLFKAIMSVLQNVLTNNPTMEIMHPHDAAANLARGVASIITVQGDRLTSCQLRNGESFHLRVTKQSLAPSSRFCCASHWTPSQEPQPPPTPSLHQEGK